MVVHRHTTQVFSQRSRSKQAYVKLERPEAIVMQ